VRAALHTSAALGFAAPARWAPARCLEVDLGPDDEPGRTVGLHRDQLIVATQHLQTSTYRITETGADLERQHHARRAGTPSTCCDSPRDDVSLADDLPPARSAQPSSFSEELKASGEWAFVGSEQDEF